MRILVTKQGNIIIQDIDDSLPNLPKTVSTFNNSIRFRAYSTGYSLKNPKSNKFQSRINNFSKTNNQFYNYPVFPSQNSKNIRNTKIKLSKNMNLEDIEITKDEINSAKHIKINERKIPFPKQFVEKYESNNLINTSNNNIFPSINSKNKESYEGSNNSLVKREKYLSLGEIILVLPIYSIIKCPLFLQTARISGQTMLLLLRQRQLSGSGSRRCSAQFSFLNCSTRSTMSIRIYGWSSRSSDP